MKVLLILFILLLYFNQLIYSFINNHNDNINYNINNNNSGSNSISNSGNDNSNNSNNSITFNYDPWLQEFHDVSYTSFSNNNPITNDAEWSNNLVYNHLNNNNNNNNNNSNNNNNTSCKINILNFNPTILSDQSYIVLSLDSNQNLQIIKYSFYNEIVWNYQFINNNNNSDCIETINSNIVIGTNYSTPNTINPFIYTPLLVYIQEYSKYYLFNLDNGQLLWNSTSTYFNCTSINYFSSLYKFYSVCQLNNNSEDSSSNSSNNNSSQDSSNSLNNNNNKSNNIFITNFIIISPFNNSLINNIEYQFNINFHYNDNTLSQSIYKRKEILFGYPVKYFNTNSTYYDAMVYINFEYGLVSLLSSDFTTQYTTWKLPDNTFNQIIPAVLSNIRLSYINYLSVINEKNKNIYLSTYNVGTGALVYKNLLASNVNSQQVFNSKLGVNGYSIIFSFNYFIPKVLSYSGVIKYPTNIMTWYINGDNFGVYDFASTLTTIYYCRLNDILIINNSSESFSINYPINNNNDNNSSSSSSSNSDSMSGSIASSEDSSEMDHYSIIYNNHICKLSLGENTVLLSLSSLKEKESLTYKAVDKMCPDLCGQNKKCTQDIGCECQPYYYPANNCSLYCYGPITCVGHGSCNELGQCVCAENTGWQGERCEICGKGYSGNNCNVTFNLKKAIVFIVIGLVVTSSICIFAFCTRKIGKKNKLKNGSCCDCTCWSKLWYKINTTKIIKPKHYQSLNEENIQVVDDEGDNL